MILEEIRIENLFSYYGSHSFPLLPPDDDRNVVLISGRNGYGKTSFLNSLKLFFAGATREIMTVQAGREMRNKKDYLLGYGDEWIGAFNRHAKGEGSKRFGISVIWQEEAGRVNASRYWQIETDGVHEVLHIAPEFGDPLEDHDGDIAGDARAFLEERLPESVLPFFLYDGEQVQQLAEANREGKLRQIERLLDLGDIDVLQEYIGKNTTTWRREANPAIEHMLDRLRGEQASLQAQCAQLESEKKDCDSDIKEIDRAIQRSDRAIQSIRQFSMQSEADRLGIQQEALRTQIETNCAALLNTFTREAPLLVHPQLLAKAEEHLEKLTAHPNRRLREELESVFRALPSRLWDEPPHPYPVASPELLEFYRRKMTRVLDGFRLDESDTRSGLLSLSASRAEAILDVLGQYSHGERERNRTAQMLRDIADLKRQLKEVERKQNDVRNLAPREQEDFEIRRREREDMEVRKSTILQRIGEIGEQLRNLNRDLEKKRAEIRQQEKQVVEGRNARDRLTLADRLSDTLDDYRAMLKTLRREEIETAINDRFSLLMTSHRLIARIRLNEDFSMHYLGADGGQIGMANISAGMKQLAAQALLWALKDVSGKEAPVVVDTPLARIDREHQENLLKRYFPQAGRQVIVLPTDSELDREKYALLSPCIYREFRLENREGDRTHVVEGSMY